MNNTLGRREHSGMVRNMETEISGCIRETENLSRNEASLYPVATAVEECCGSGAEASSDRDFKYANFSNSSLVKIRLSDSQLQGANLRGAKLQGADLRGAELQGANLFGAQLQGADLFGVQLQGADLLGPSCRARTLSV